MTRSHSFFPLCPAFHQLTRSYAFVFLTSPRAYRPSPRCRSIANESLHGVLAWCAEDVDQEWDGGSPRYSSDNPDPETLEMQRQWPRLAIQGTDEAAHRSSEGHSSTQKVDSERAAFDPVTVPTLARRPTGHSHNPYLGHLNGGGTGESANSSPWIPQTPESPYPPTLLSPRSFSRHAATCDAERSNSITRTPLSAHPPVEEEDDSPWRAL